MNVSITLDASVLITAYQIRMTSALVFFVHNWMADKIANFPHYKLLIAWPIRCILNISFLPSI